MLELRTIRPPAGLWPSGEYRERIAGEVREMGRQTLVLRTVIHEGVEEETLGGDLHMALLHLCNYLDGSRKADHEDEFGIEAPHGWAPWYTAHLFRTAVHFLERGQLRENIDADLHHKVAANLADLAARVMYLEATPRAGKTLDLAARGELPW